MYAYCDKCGGRFADQLLCPTCGCQLRRETALVKAIPLPLDDSQSSADWLPFLRRMGIGLLLVFGLFQALLHLAHGTELLLVNSVAPHSDWFVSMLSLAVFFAAMVTGTANRRAEANGFFLGLFSSGTFLGVEHVQGASFPEEWYVGLPVMQALIGTVAGFVGRLLYMPAPRFSPANKPDTRLNSAAKKKASPPIHWVNIVIGVIIANVALVYAEPIRSTMASVLGGSGGVGSGRFVVWEISMIGSLLAGVAAGANTKWGLRQGTLAGLFASVGLVAAATKKGVSKIPAADFWVDQLSLSSENSTVVYGVMASSMMITMILGGWLGSHLFPPRKRP